MRCPRSDEADGSWQWMMLAPFLRAAALARPGLSPANRGVKLATACRPDDAGRNLSTNPYGASYQPNSLHNPTDLPLQVTMAANAQHTRNHPHTCANHTAPRPCR